MSFIINNLGNKNIEDLKHGRHIREFEHQVGRYLNFKSLIAEIVKDDLSGDILEFGSWQGLGLIEFDLLLGPSAKQIIGVDSFEGLPESSTIWNRGDFNNTSIEHVQSNLHRYAQNSHRIKLVKGWFSDRSTAEQIYALTDSVCLVHFDADLGSSTTEALRIVEPFLIMRKEPIYFVFDDWGCNPDEVPDSFLNWVEIAEVQFSFEAQKINSTLLSRSYKLTFK